MKVPSIILAFVATAILASPIETLESRATSITFEYYPAANCKTGGVTTTVTKCTNLKSAANSFKVTGKKLPNGCTLKGFSDAGCKGFEEQYIDGPSLNKCDKPADSSGKFKSVQLNCD